MSDDLELLKRQNADLTAKFADFKTFREGWDELIRRRARVKLEANLSPYADGIDIQSADLEFYLGKFGEIKMLNPTKTDCISLDQGKQAKDDVEDIRIWLGSQWRKVNDGRRLDINKAEGQDRYGLAIERMFWDMPPEPESDVDDREAYFKGLNSDCFRIEPVHPLECRWWPLRDPEIFIQESEIPYVEALKLENEDHKFFSLDGAGKVAFLGERQPMNSITGEQSAKKLRVLTRAMKTPGTDDWTIADYVYPTGTDMAETGAQLNEVAVPFERCPFFLTPSGAERPLESDPHLRYRPRMYPLYVVVQESNYWRTKLAALVVKYSTFFYMNLSKLNPDQQTFAEEIFPVEGTGATRRFVFKMPDPGSDEIAATPQIERLPFELDAITAEILAENKAAIERYAPSRFQSGDVSRTELSEGTAQAFVDMRQASALSPSTDLARSDATIKDEQAAMIAAVLYWDADVKGASQKRYYTVTTGEEPLLKGAPEAGQQVYVDADKLRRPIEIIVTTQNQTQAEEQQQAIMAFQDKAQGVLSEEQVLQRRGFDDPRKQMEVLEAEKQRLDLEPHKRQLITAQNVTLFTALTGLQVASLLGGSPPQPPGTPGQAQLPAGGQPAQGQPPPAPQPAGPAVTPAPVGGPVGGSSGMGAMA